MLREHFPRQTGGCTGVDKFETVDFKGDSTYVKAKAMQREKTAHNI
jgi:hypothetical protein